MSDNRSKSPADAEQLDEAYAAYLQALETGTPLDREEFTAKYAELADDLDDHEKSDRLAAALRETVVEPPRGDELELPEGTVVGNYRIVKEIGRHGQGVWITCRGKR